MQEPDLAEMPSSVGVSNWTFLKHLSAEVYALSLPETTEGADGYHLSQNLPSEDGDGGNDEASPDSLPDAFAAEAGSTWGDFEGFSEVTSENQSHIPASLENLNGEQASTKGTDVNDNHCTTSCGHVSFQTAGQNGGEVFPNVLMKASLSSEDVIKLSFPEVPVPQFLENISSLNQMLGTNTEDVGVPEHAKMQPCTDSGSLWKLLTRARNPSGLRCPWNDSHCQENLLAVLGVDAHQKLSASPDPKQSHLFTYNLFLKKTPSTGSPQYITVPQKKRIFTTQNLKMKMFSSNVC
ncbi:PREDICTED: uncharacterized protein C14orf79 homolog isoform X1 [Gekko japonicus]|uniref:Uncharacterized protein C14orf79 homolog isoform X1 n=1 Tax=Gekko japonicus TaxID=146911 RepID=A0ABM1KZB8_GEKJA|nr:PREDICTED: uncharacterized protein C14orf79 homolog isoform X1 [Gekko japonicus]